MQFFLFKKTAVFLAVALPLFSPFSVAAAGIPNTLLSDHDLVDSAAMNLTQLQTFLMQKGSSLAYYYAPDVDGVTKTAAEIISRAATTYTLSPKFLLALLQREQSLVEAKRPSQGQYDWATGFAVCDSCAKDDPDVLPWKGFAKQVEGAARQIRNRYLPDLETKGTTVSGIGPGITKEIDGTPVTFANKATAVLYTYTPHLHGNINFVNIWQRWFSRRYPDGSLVQVSGSKEIWRILDGEKRKFASKTVFLSLFNEKEILPISQADLDAYSEGLGMQFSNYSLLQTPSGDIYLLDGDSKRKIASMEVFRKLGFNPDEIEEATDEDLAIYQEGPTLSLENAYPRGALVQDKKTGGVYWVQDGTRYPIWSKEILNARFPKKPMTQASTEQLATYPSGAPVPFRDGQLIGTTGKPTVYVVEHGMRRPIKDEVTFHHFGWQMKNILWTDEKAINLHPLGDVLEDASAETTLSAASAE
jgi:hypothetical protein